MAIGIIAEFNPFHNGHKYLIGEAKKQNHNEPVVCIMSGAFVQRGAPAITDKWTRARMALENGADLVLELPVSFAMNTAQKFAFGAVASLNAAGIIDTLAFGSECGDPEALRRAAGLIVNEPPEVSARLRELLACGKSYPAARAGAYAGLTSVLSSPNDILGVEYIRAAIELGAEFKLCAVSRRGAAHDSTELHGSFASASEIRRIINAGEDASPYTPYAGTFPVYDGERLGTAVLAKLRSCGAQYLKSINDVTEGLENKFVRTALSVGDINSLCRAVKSRRYPLSRIRRIVWSALVGITKETAALPPSYIRVLGMNSSGRTLLKQMKKTAVLPVIIKAADYSGDKIFNTNKQAEDLFALAAPEPQLMRGGRDLTVSPVVLY